MRTLLTAIFVLILSLGSVHAIVVVNEAMVNEPSNQVNLEWFELYNESTSPVNLSFFTIRIGVTTIQLSGTLGGGEYAIVCRDSIAFVNAFVADPSSIDYRIIPRSFSLSNAAGRIVTIRLSTPEDSLLWGEPGGDGISWERLTSQSPLIAQCEDPSGSTPGRVNSVAILPVDLALDTVSVIRDDTGGVFAEFFVSNVGLSNVQSRALTVYLVNPNDPDDRSQVVTTLTVPPTDTGFTSIVTTPLVLGGYYASVGAWLQADDDTTNNKLTFTAPGLRYPPVRINEFLANPTTALNSEWVELYNQSDTTIDIGNWLIGDALGEHTILGAPLQLEPGRFIVLAQSSVAFNQFYAPFDSLLIQPTGWRLLNNDGDTVRLVDEFGIVADRFGYSETFDDNFSWSLSTSGDTTWGQSAQSGGDPGEANEVRIMPTAEGLSVSIEPRIISPDDNGIDDMTVITVNAPPANDYTIKLYDDKGREVVVFEDQSPVLNAGGRYEWDGRTLTGGRLPVGIYILYVEAGGVESRKETVVIAR